MLSLRSQYPIINVFKWDFCHHQQFNPLSPILLPIVGMALTLGLFSELGCSVASDMRQNWEPGVSRMGMEVDLKSRDAKHRESQTRT